MLVQTSGSAYTNILCEAKGGVPVFPTFNNSTGNLRTVLWASVGHGPACSPRGLRDEQAYTTVYYQIDKSFVGAATGTHTLRSHWHLAWHDLLVTKVAKPNNSTFANYAIDLMFGLYDQTSGQSWVPNTIRLGGLALNGINGTVNQTVHLNLSIPIVVPITRGDSYFWGVQISMYSDAGEFDLHAQAYSKLSVGTVGGGFVLSKVTL